MTREQRGTIFKLIMAAISIMTAVGLLYALRDLILPVLVGAILAFLCKPLLNSFKYHWLHEGVRVSGLAILFVGFLFSAIWLVRSSLPSDAKKLELLTRVQYKLNEKTDTYFQVDKPKEERGVIAKVLHKELSPVIKDINNYLTLTQSQQQSLQEFYSRGQLKEQYYQFYLKNIDHKILEEQREPSSSVSKPEPIKSFTLARILNVLSIWIVMPLVFIFLLFDKGEIHRYYVRFIPNRYFELTLTVFEQVNLAIGKYLRGTVLECSLVGLTMFIGLYFVGLDIQAAFLIGMIAGVTNAIPFVGPFVGLVVGLAYGIIAENVTPLIPFMTGDDLMIGILATVLLTQLLDNAFYQPIILGSAVNLHPIVVVLSVVGGSLLFGFAGILLAIPTIVVIKVSVETLVKGLKDYYII